MKKIVILTSFMMLMASNVSAQLKVTSVNHRDCPYDFNGVTINDSFDVKKGASLEIRTN